MPELTYRTTEESHGMGLIALVEGLPAGVPIDSALIDGELRRRQGGYGRGGRQKIETDRAEFLTGVRLGRTAARETAARVAAGGLARCLLREFGIEVFGFVRAVGPAAAEVAVTEDN